VRVEVPSEVELERMAADLLAFNSAHSKAKRMEAQSARRSAARRPPPAIPADSAWQPGPVA